MGYIFIASAVFAWIYLTNYAGGLSSRLGMMTFLIPPGIIGLIYWLNQSRANQEMFIDIGGAMFWVYVVMGVGCFIKSWSWD